MRLRINRIELNHGYSQDQLSRAVQKRLRCKPGQIHNLRTVRRSIDGRRHPPRMILAVEVDIRGRRPPGRKNVEVVKPAAATKPVRVEQYRGRRPVVVGAGPAGLMAAYALAEAGMRPLLLERGESAQERKSRVAAFWRDGELNTESNVLYGEGGAGLFSDGKLTSRSKDRRLVRRFLEILVKCGASPDILVDAEPHIGSDVLTELVPRLRERIVEMGGEVRFSARLDNLAIDNGRLRGIVTADGGEIDSDLCVLATGHSARDVYRMLHGRGVRLEAKPFAVGVRIELPQSRIDAAQWGGAYPELGKASFRLTRKEENGLRACYTFCMCPGGMVIACASSEGMLTTNGMSLSKRAQPFGNAAFLVPVTQDDFKKGGTEVPAALAGIEFQQQLEQAAFLAGGGDYALPAQRLPEFLAGNSPSELPKVRSCRRAVPAQLRGLLPEFIEESLLGQIPAMLSSMRGTVIDEMIVYASETRSSAPVRILRDESGQSVSVRGLYPCGEGAGYAGGIVSSGIDGLRAAEQIAGGFVK